MALSAAAHADTNELRIAKQPGLSYLPAVIAEKLQLVEKHARAAGLSDFKTTWTRLTNGGASNDALLSGNVDMVISGGPNMLILWAKTSGRVKGVVATGALPMLLVTNNPNVKTIADFTDQDRIAVPTIRVGTQAAGRARHRRRETVRPWRGRALQFAHRFARPPRCDDCIASEGKRRRHGAFLAAAISEPGAQNSRCAYRLEFL